MVRRVVLSWSSGKDSAWTLHLLQNDPAVEVVGLLTTYNESDNRVGIHSTRLKIVEAQARAADLPLMAVPLPWPCPNSVYEAALGHALAESRQQGATHIAFGDLFLEDIREYRVRQFGNLGLKLLFPIWQTPTDLLARKMVDDGLESIVTCIDDRKLPRSFAGRRFNHSFLDDLPPGVDPCGENGEFHTCVVGGPMFDRRLAVTVGEITEENGFIFADLKLNE